MAGKSKKRGNKESQVRKNAPSVKKDSNSEGPKEPESGVEDMSTKRSSDDDTLIENGATSSFLNEDLPEDNSVACYDENGVRKMEGIGIESSRGKNFAAHEELFLLDKFVNMLMRSVLPRESSENVKLVCNLITTLLSEIGELSKKDESLQPNSNTERQSPHLNCCQNSTDAALPLRILETESNISQILNNSKSIFPPETT